MAKKEYLVLRSFFHTDKMYYKGDSANHFNLDTTKKLEEKKLIGLRWRPEVIPLEKPEPKKKTRTRKAKK